MQLFFSLLAIVALAGGGALLLTRWLAGRNRAVTAFHGAVAPVAVPLAALVATTSMLGSLYFSEIADLVPCKLCWYQRTLMYPLAIILVVAAIRRRPDVRTFALPLACLGVFVSSYHYLVEWFPQLESDVCDITVPCTTVWFRRLGFVSLPFMALCGFLAVIGLLLARADESSTS